MTKTITAAGNAAYLIFGEDLRSYIIRRQVIDVIVALRQKIRVRKFFLVVFLPWDKYIRSRKSIAGELLYLRQNEIICHVIPIPISFPWYSLREKKWKMVRQYHTFLYVPMILLYTLPAVLFYLLFRNVRLFHCRSYPVSLSVLLIKRIYSKIAFIFDPRSDYPEERALQKNRSVNDIDFIVWKYLEKKICAAADTVIVIGSPFERHFKDIYGEMQTVNIYNNVNTREFVLDAAHRKQLRTALQADNKVIFCYSGSMYKNYWNDPELYAKFIADFNSQIDIKPLFLFLVPEDCRTTLMEALRNHGIDPSLYVIESPDFSEMPKYLSACDIGMYFFPYYSPRVGIKFVEYCSMGLPTIVNMNIGGAADLVINHQLGLSLNNNILSDSPVKAGEDEIGLVQRLIDEKESYKKRCRVFAEKNFDTTVVVEKYRSIYSELLA